MLMWLSEEEYLDHCCKENSEIKKKKKNLLKNILLSYVGGQPAGKQLGKRRLGDLAWHQVEHEPSVCPCQKG